MLLDSFRFILSTGDNAYYDGTYSQFDANVFQIYQGIFSKAAVFPTLGNHDYHTDDGAPYLDIFVMVNDILDNRQTQISWRYE
jgi:hypothetical protein